MTLNPASMSWGTTRAMLHVFGDIHAAYDTEHTIFVNAALLGVHGAVDRAPFAFEMTSK
jgi:hypothetical protein